MRANQPVGFGRVTCIHYIPFVYDIITASGVGIMIIWFLKYTNRIASVGIFDIDNFFALFSVITKSCESRAFTLYTNLVTSSPRWVFILVPSTS